MTINRAPPATFLWLLAIGVCVVNGQDPWSVPTIFDDVTEITAHIGPSGGPRGYQAITGQPSYNVSWYLNGDLAPQMVMRRGTTYTFKVNGGNDPNDDANYHPFYLTTSARGGFQQLSPSERLEETPLAGITIVSSATGVYGYDADGVAPICQYEETWSSAENEWSPYEDWAATLDKSCAQNDWITSQAATITFTPDETTPNKIYYQCVNHFYMGWEILVVDNANAPPPTNPPVEPPVAPPIDMEPVELAVVALEGPLQGATMSFVVNQGDSRAGGQDTVTMIYEVPAVAWVAIAFNNNGGLMPGSEAVIGLPDENSVQKYSLAARSPDGVQPMADAQQTLIEASITQEEGVTTLQFTKILEEPGEIPIVVGPNTFLGAFGSSNNLGVHLSRASFVVDLASGGFENVESREQSLWKAHGWCAGIAWGVLSPLAVGAAILRKMFEAPLWFKIHQTLNTLVILLTIGAFSLAVAAINKESAGADPEHFNPDPFPHRTVGLVIFVLALVQAVGGFLRPHVPEEGKEKSKVRSSWELGHKFLGISLMAMSWYQVQSGIKIYSSFFETGVDMLAVFWGVVSGIAGLIVLGFIKIKLFEKETNEPAGNGSKPSSHTEAAEGPVEGAKFDP